MALRFRRSVKIAPGIRMNLSKSGIGMSAGVKGARVGANSRGTYSSVGIPGTGIYSFNQTSSGKGRSSQASPISNTIPSRQLKTSMSTAPVWVMVCGLFSLIFSAWFGILLLSAGFIALIIQTKKPEYGARKNISDGVKAYGKSDYNTAIQKFSAAVEILPSEVSLYYHLGLSYFSNKQNDDAVQAFIKYTELAPNDTGARFLLALAYKEAGNTNESIKLLQSLPDMGEELNIEKLISLADCFKAEGKTEIAIDTLKQSPLRKKTLTDSLLRVHYALGELYETSGKNKSAKKHFEKIYIYDANFADIEEKMRKLETV